MHSSAVGKVLLAYMNPLAQQPMIDRMKLERFTPNTITGRERFLKTLSDIRIKGYGLDDEEHAIGLRCVAAPIFNEAREAIAGISLSGPAARVTDRRFRELAEMVQRTARVITREFGGKPPEE